MTRYRFSSPHRGVPHGGSIFLLHERTDRAGHTHLPHGLLTGLSILVDQPDPEWFYTLMVARRGPGPDGERVLFRRRLPKGQTTMTLLEGVEIPKGGDYVQIHFQRGSFGAPAPKDSPFSSITVDLEIQAYDVAAVVLAGWEDDPLSFGRASGAGL